MIFFLKHHSVSLKPYVYSFVYIHKHTFTNIHITEVYIYLERDFVYDKTYLVINKLSNVINFYITVCICGGLNNNGPSRLIYLNV